MALISITIDDAKLAALVDGIAQVRLYQDTVNGEPNPVSKTQFAHNIFTNALNSYVENIYSGWVASAAKMSASAQVRGAVSSVIS